MQETSFNNQQKDSSQFSMVVHVGAHFGQGVDKYRELGVKHIVWVEADVTTYSRLQEYIKIKEVNSVNKINHIFVNALVGDKDGEIINFYPFNNDGQSSSRFKPTQLLKNTWVGLDIVNEVKEFRTYRLDSILAELKLEDEKYTYSKLVIDVQGGEYQVLLGLGSYIDKFSEIEVEVSKQEIYEGQKLFGYIDNFLTLKNFKRRENNISEIPWHGDVTYHRNKAEEIISDYCSNYFSALLTFKQIESNLLFQNNQTRFLEFCAEQRHTSKSQLFQDLLVIYLLKEKRNGFFVEFGAADGVFLSNSFLLEDKYDWEGILCEPAKSWKEALSKNRSCIIDNRCVYHTSGHHLPFIDLDNNNELSTLQSYTNSDLHALNRIKGNEYLVETISLNDLLDQHNAPKFIDYLSIDTEGSEFDILKEFDFEKYNFKIITVEHNHTEMRAEIYNLLVNNNYSRIFKDLSRFDDWYILN